MNREYHHWHSPNLNREMELLVFGHSGARVLVFPTSCGRFYQFEDFSMIGSLAHHLDEGWIQLYCVDSVDAESWYNKAAPPRARVARHEQYEQYILKEVFPFMAAKNSNPFTMTTGCSFGAYHSMNLTLRHPGLVNRCIAVSGCYDMHPFLDGYYDQDCYYNSPVDFLPNLTDGRYLKPLNTTCQLIMTAGDRDICLAETERLAGIMAKRNIRHTLDVWGNGTVHDWPAWKQMILKFI